MDKELGKIQKNPETDIVVRIDDYMGKKGLTIREFVRSERYTGFTKAGTRIPADKFHEFKAMINSVNEKELLAPSETVAQKPQTASGTVSGMNHSNTDSNVKRPVKKSAAEDFEEVEF